MSVLIAATRTVVVVVARIVETMIIAKDAVPSQSYRPRGRIAPGQIRERPVPRRLLRQFLVRTTSGDYLVGGAHERTPSYRIREYRVERSGGGDDSRFFRRSRRYRRRDVENARRKIGHRHVLHA